MALHIFFSALRSGGVSGVSPSCFEQQKSWRGCKKQQFNELLLQTIRLCLCCQEEETLGTRTPALGFLTRQILALSLFALPLHLVFFFSSLLPPSLFCVSSLQMWLREPLPWQSTQRNLLLWVILHWTCSYTSGRDQTHVPTEPRVHEHLVAIILSPPPFPPPPPLDPPTPTPSCTHRFYSAAADGAFWHFWCKGMGALVRWRSDLSPKCQAHQKERTTELIAAETDE